MTGRMQTASAWITLSASIGFMLAVPTVGFSLGTRLLGLGSLHFLMGLCWSSLYDFGGRLWLLASFGTTLIITYKVITSFMIEQEYDCLRKLKRFPYYAHFVLLFAIFLPFAGMLCLVWPVSLYGLNAMKGLALATAIWMLVFDWFMLSAVRKMKNARLTKDFRDVVFLIDIPVTGSIFLTLVLALSYKHLLLPTDTISGRFNEVFVTGLSAGAIAVEIWFANLIFWILFHSEESDVVQAGASGGKGASSSQEIPSTSSPAQVDPSSSSLRRKVLIGVAAAVIMSALAASWLIWSRNFRHENSVIRIGIATWPGFASGMVGNEKGYFPGISLQYRTIDDLAARHAAFRSGDLDIMVSSMDLWVQEKAQGLDGQAFLVTDESAGADGIVVNAEIKTIANLRGKRVAFARATPSHYLLFKVLENAGLTPADIVQVPVDDPGLAGQAFIGGKVDAAVTWEPFLTQVKESGKGRVLASSRDFPGTIVDLLVASPKLLQQPEVLKNFIRGWLESVGYIETHPNELAQVMATGLGVKKEDAEGMMAGVRFADTARNRYFFDSSDLAKSPLALVAEDAGDFWKRQGIISAVPQIPSLISGIFNGIPERPGPGGK